MRHLTKDEIEAFFEKIEQYKTQHMPWYDGVMEIIHTYEQIKKEYDKALNPYTMITTDHTWPYPATDSTWKPTNTEGQSQ